MRKTWFGPIVLGVLVLSSSRSFGSDISIPFNNATGHPAILLAWRNTQKIFEAEISVQNSSLLPKRVGVMLEILDAKGSVLMRRPDEERLSYVDLPSRDLGGSDGEIVQVRGSREANLLIDLLDRERVNYHVKASVFDESSPHPIAVATRSFHANALVEPGSNHMMNFTIKNDSLEQLSYRFQRKSVGYDFGSLEYCPEIDFNGDLKIAAKGEFRCYVHLKARDVVEENRVSTSILSWEATSAEGAVRKVDAREWYYSNDTTAPKVEEFIKKVQPDGSIHLEALVSSGPSGIEEASGVRVAYSLDGGITFSNRIMAYLDGNFHGPTRFLATLGPFTKESQVSLWLTVTNGAGVTSRHDLGRLLL